MISFNGNKTITTGGRYNLTTNLKFKKALHLSLEAKNINGSIFMTAGFNYRMPAINASIGIAQLKT